MKSISTHVLDTSLGRPAAGIPVTLARREGDGFVPAGEGITNDDGRVAPLANGPLVAGVYRVHFELDAYFAAASRPSFYPEATVVFRVEDPGAHYHVPLLLSPFGYSTYRGS